jgi:hypothetical protein
MAKAPSAFHSARDLLRLLKALERQAKPSVLELDGSARIAIEAGGVIRCVAFPAETVAAALQADLAAMAADALVLSEAGRGHLARHRNPGRPFLSQHRPLGSEARPMGKDMSELTVDLAESPLAWLRRRRGKDGTSLVSDHAFEAGERLRRDFTLASLMPHVTANWGAAVSRRRRGPEVGLDYSDMVLAARQRVARALDAVGPELAGILVDVCCFLKGLEQVEAERSWPARSAKIVLGLGLERLAAHYGLAGEARGAERRGALRFWGATDYRPEWPSR